MNKAITEGLQLMPPPFAGGLSVWSSEDGLAGQASYDGATNAAIVTADQDFGGCLELIKTDNTQQLRWTGETPIIPGCYLQIRAKVKAMSGNLPTVRIGAWAGSNGSTEVTGLATSGTEVTLATYGEIVEVSAIVGIGARGGVDMVWGAEPVLGHFGIDLTGSNGGVVRIDDIEIEDVTNFFLSDILNAVDVIDYGALGDGVTDDSAAFDAADADADGRDVIVPEGVYYLGNHVTMDNPTRFVGTVTMPTDKRLILRKNYDFPAYVDAFGDDVTAFEKAVQALFNNSDHDNLDLKGYRVSIDRPIDIAAAVVSPTTYEIRRVIANGEFYVNDSAAWDVTSVTSQASYNANNPEKLTNVANVANIEVGSLVTANTGVGREVFVKSVNVGAGEVTLSLPLWGAPGNQSYTFTRFRYVLDFSGMTKITRFNLANIDFKCNGYASGILLPQSGANFMVRDGYFTKPADRAITSHAQGCQDLHIENCQFVADDQADPAINRTSIAFNVNENDAKVRNSRFQKFGVTMVLAGTGNLIVGCHWFQGDNETQSPRTPGVILSRSNCMTVMTGNYIDNCFVEWGNEHDAEPDFSNEFSFGGLSMTGNIFTHIDAAPWTPFLVVKPYGPGHYIHGLNLTGNTFRIINGSIDRIETVDNSVADLDFSRFRNITFAANTFNSVDQPTINPVTLEFTQSTEAGTWTLDPSAYLPFGGWTRVVEGVCARGELTDSAGDPVYDRPSVLPLEGGNSNKVQLKFSGATKGTVNLTVRADNPY